MNSMDPESKMEEVKDICSDPDREVCPDLKVCPIQDIGSDPVPEVCPDVEICSDPEVSSEREVGMDICGDHDRMLANSVYNRSEDCSKDLVSEEANLFDGDQSNELSVKVEPTEVKPDVTEESTNQSSVSSVPDKADQFSLSTNNLSLIRGQQLLNGISNDEFSLNKLKVEIDDKEAKESESEKSSNSRLTNGHHDKSSSSSSSHSKKSHRTDEKSTHSSSSHRDRDRHRPRRANIGIQCRRDKNLEKTVGFSSNNAESSIPEAKNEAEFVCSPRYAGFSMANPCYNLGSKYRFGNLMRVETYPNGGGKVLHLWQDEFNHFSEQDQDELAKDFIKVNIC